MQEQLEGGQLPMRQLVTQRDQPELSERAIGQTYGADGSDHGVFSWRWWRLDSAAAAVDNGIFHARPFYINVGVRIFY